MSNEVKATENKTFAIIANKDLINASLTEDVQGLNLTFPKVKVPSGGATAFEIDTGDSENPEMVKELRCVIIVNQPAFSLFKEAYNGESRLPDCYSSDGKTGVGNPGGDCAKCPFNQFGPDGTKKCKNKRALYLVFENQLFPSVLLLPTGSLQNFTKYAQANLFKQRKLSQVVTKITLKKATNKTGIPFSQAVFTFERMLSDDEKQKLTGLSDFVKEYAKSHVPQSQADDDIPFVDTETGEVIKPL